MILIIWFSFYLCSVEYELLILMDGHKFFSLCRVKLAMVRHMYRFCINIRRERQERNGKISFLLYEAEVSKGCNLNRKFGAASNFTILDEGLLFISNNYSDVQKNNCIR